MSRRLTRLDRTRRGRPRLNRTLLDLAQLSRTSLDPAPLGRTVLNHTSLCGRPARAAALFVCTLLVVISLAAPALAKKGRAAVGGRAAVVVDERLSALREAPDLSAGLLQRLGRGRVVSLLRGQRVVRDGVTFYRVGVTRRTSGWVQAEALVSPAREGDDARLLRLIKGSADFDRVERAAIFLETFPRSALRPAVLLLLGESAEAAAQRLSQEARRRLDGREMAAGGAPTHSYFLNLNSLDRFNRLGVRFAFDRQAKAFRYDGESWREILRRHPRSPEAEEARKRLESLTAAGK